MTVATEVPHAPDGESRQTTLRDLALMFTVFAFAAYVPLTNAILSLGIPVPRLEVGLVYAVLAAAALLAAVVAMSIGKYFRTLVLALVVLVYIDIGYSGNILADDLATPIVALGVVSESVARKIIICLTLGVLVLTFWLLRKRAPIILAVAFGAALLSTFAVHGAHWARDAVPQGDSARAALSAANIDRPLVVFLLFDELASVAALPKELPATAELRERIFAFHKHYGFRLFDRVFSRHYWTYNSIPDLLNYEYKRTARNVSYAHPQGGGSPSVKVLASRYFEDMARLGYRISVFESGHLHYCEISEVHHCEKLDSYNPLSDYLGPIRTPRTLLLIAIALRTIRDSYVVNLLLTGLDRMTPLPNYAAHLDAVQFPLWFDRIERYIMGAPRGTLIFAHILVPHAPYALDPQCAVKPNVDNPYELATHHSSEEDFGKLRLVHYGRYLGQEACVYARLERLLERTTAKKGLSDAVFIISGDHGSRISKSRFEEEMDRQDYIDSYATHFSVRSSGIAPGVDHTFIPLQRLFATLYGKDLEDDVPCDQSVLAETHESSDFVVVDMPTFGSQASEDAANGMLKPCASFRKLHGVMEAHGSK